MRIVPKTTREVRTIIREKSEGMPLLLMLTDLKNKDCKMDIHVYNYYYCNTKKMLVTYNNGKYSIDDKVIGDIVKTENTIIDIFNSISGNICRVNIEKIESGKIMITYLEYCEDNFKPKNKNGEIIK